jgi:acetyl esterase
MPVDPEIAPLLERINEAPPMSSMSPPEARDLFRMLTEAGAKAGRPIELAGTEDLEVDGGDGPLPARIYRPLESAGGPTPTLVFFHGGGFVIGDVESYDGQVRALCSGIGATVLSVGYRLAPEDPFPAAVEDGLAATRWALANVDHLGGDAERVGIGGDSAGGNLSAVVAQELRGSEPPLRAQILLYPATDFTTERPSYGENGSGYYLTIEEMVWFRQNYLGDDHPNADPRVSPLLAADLSELPPALVVTAEYYPLRDDGEAYAAALEQAGNAVVKRRFDGQIHGFLGFGPFSEAACRAIGDVCEEARKLLGRD